MQKHTFALAARTLSEWSGTTLNWLHLEHGDDDSTGIENELELELKQEWEREQYREWNGAVPEDTRISTPAIIALIFRLITL